MFEILHSRMCDALAIPEATCREKERESERERETDRESQRPVWGMLKSQLKSPNLPRHPKPAMGDTIKLVRQGVDLVQGRVLLLVDLRLNNCVFLWGK